MPTYAEKPTLITLHIQVLPESEGAFAIWQAQFNAKIITFPGFVSLEFLSPTEKQSGWLVLQRFSNEACASTWQNSTEHQELLEDLKSHSKEVREALAEETAALGNVTEIFVTEVTAEKEQAFRDWSAKIHQAEARFQGFRSVYLQSPREGTKGHWITLLQFDTLEHLDRWLESAERRDLLDESRTLISSLETHRILSPYAGWFASIAKEGELPPVWKQTMIVLLVLFPIVMLELKYLSPITASLNSSVGTFIGNAISVVLISFPMMPIAVWFLGWWLVPEGRTSWPGTLLVLLLYVVEIILFWNFL